MFLSVWSLEEYFLLGNSNTYGFHAAFNGISLSLGERVAFLAMCGEYGGKVQKGGLSLPGRQALVARWNQGNSCGLAALQDSKAAKKRQDDLKIPATMSWLNTPLNCWNRCVPLYNNKLTSNHIFLGLPWNCWLVVLDKLKIDNMLTLEMDAGVARQALPAQTKETSRRWLEDLATYIGSLHQTSRRNWGL